MTCMTYLTSDSVSICSQVETILRKIEKRKQSGLKSPALQSPLQPLGKFLCPQCNSFQVISRLGITVLPTVQSSCHRSRPSSPFSFSRPSSPSPLPFSHRWNTISMENLAPGSPLISVTAAFMWVLTTYTCYLFNQEWKSYVQWRVGYLRDGDPDTESGIQAA